MKRTAVLVILVTVALLLVFSNKRERQKVLEAREDQTLIHTMVQAPIRRAANAERQVPSEPELDATLQLLGEAVPAEDQPFMIRAVKSAQVIENEKRTFPKNSPGDRLLDGLQRKLFIDDYTYAALATGKMDSTRATEVFGKLVEKLRQLQHVPVQLPSEEAARSDNHVADRMSSHYQALLQSQNEGYSNVYKTVSAFSPNVLSSDLFKDALAYVALRTEVNEWMDEEIKDRQTVLARQTEHIKNAQLAGTSSANYEAVSQSQVANLMRVQGAYHNVFSFRLADNHGLEAGPVLTELDKLKLAGVGPELIVPPK